MKNIKSAILLMAVLILSSSCEYGDFHEFPDAPLGFIYNIAINFRDVSGNDLVLSLAEERWKPEGDHSNWFGEINPTRYNLDIRMSNPPKYYDYSINGLYTPEMKDLNIVPDARLPYFKVYQYDDNYNMTSDFYKDPYVHGEGYYYLINQFIIENEQDRIVYKIICPSIFGDESVHEIMTYWGDDTQMFSPYNRESWWQRPLCTRVLFDGQEIAFSNKVYFSYAIFSQTDPSIEFPRDQYAAFIEIILDK